MNEIKCMLTHSSEIAVFTVVSDNQVFGFLKRKTTNRFFVFLSQLIIDKKTTPLSTARFKM
jgi:hypothetical protein